MNLNDSIAAVEAMTFLSQGQRDAIIAQLVLASGATAAAPTVPAAPAVILPDAVFQKANVADALAGKPWPRYIKTKNGATMQVYAPLNPQYEATQVAQIFGGSPGHFVFDPSNGGLCTPPQPLRSPAGFPLFYAIGAGGVPVGSPMVYNGEQGYANDDALLAWLARKPGYEASLNDPKAWQAVFDQMAKPTAVEAASVPPVTTDPVVTEG